LRRIAVSGHRDLSPDTSDLVEAAMQAALGDEAADVTGLSCLADGADQIFAQVILDLGGQIEAVVPSDAYREGLPRQAHAAYDRLIERLSCTGCLTPSPRPKRTRLQASS
jgi:hypothetical protein